LGSKGDDYKKYCNGTTGALVPPKSMALKSFVQGPEKFSAPWWKKLCSEMAGAWPKMNGLGKWLFISALGTKGGDYRKYCNGSKTGANVPAVSMPMKSFAQGFNKWTAPWWKQHCKKLSKQVPYLHGPRLYNIRKKYKFQIQKKCDGRINVKVNVYKF